jgi:thiol:disulfide interchange protein
LAGWLLLVLIPVCTGCSEVKWDRDFSKGLQRAAQLRRRALVQFHSNISSECRKMDKDVFPDPEVQKQLSRFVPIRVDVHLNQKLAERYNVVVTPSFLVFRPGLKGMELLSQHGGAMDADTFRIFLIKNSLY